VSTILNFQKLQRATSNLRDTFAELMKELMDSSTSNGTSCDPSAPPSTDRNFDPPLCIKIRHVVRLDPGIHDDNTNMFHSL